MNEAESNQAEPEQAPEEDLDGKSRSQESSQESSQEDGDGSGDDSEALARRVADLEAELEQHRDEALRLRAEMENLRRRTAREMENARKFALERFMADLLEVRDSLERGLDAAAGEQVTVDQLREGKALTFRMLEKTLAQHGLQVVDPKGERFDPELHEAIGTAPTPDQEPDTVVDVIQKGFQLNDRLLRPARVVVARPPA